MFIFSSWHFHINSVSLILRQARIGAKERKGKKLSKLLNEKEKKNQHPDSYQGNEFCGEMWDLSLLWMQGSYFLLELEGQVILQICVGHYL